MAKARGGEPGDSVSGLAAAALRADLEAAIATGAPQARVGRALPHDGSTDAAWDAHAVSADGQVLMVDFEFRSGAAIEDDLVNAQTSGDKATNQTALNGLNAIYLSPSLARSRQAGRSLEEVAITAIAATHLYARVHIQAANAIEAARLGALIERFTPARPVEIDVVTIG